MAAGGRADWPELKPRAVARDCWGIEKSPTAAGSRGGIGEIGSVKAKEKKFLDSHLAGGRSQGRRILIRLFLVVILNYFKKRWRIYIFFSTLVNKSVPSFIKDCCLIDFILLK